MMNNLGVARHEGDTREEGIGANRWIDEETVVVIRTASGGRRGVTSPRNTESHDATAVGLGLIGTRDDLDRSARGTCGS